MAIIYGNSQILYACLLILWETCFRWLLLISWGRLFVTYNAVFFFLKSNFLITELKIDWADQTLRSWSSYQIIELHDPFLIQTITPYSLVLLKRCFNHPCPVFFFFHFFFFIFHHYWLIPHFLIRLLCSSNFNTTNQKPREQYA